MQVLEAGLKPAATVPNIAELLERNVLRFGERMAYQQKENGNYAGVSWNQLHERVLNIAWNLRKQGFKEGSKIVIYSPNRLEMLELELAVMASGGISVPVFAWFNAETASLLIRHSGAEFLAVAGEFQLARISKDLPLKRIFVFDDIHYPGLQTAYPFSELRKPREEFFQLSTGADPAAICLNMYTSGTMGIPKCVQLSHRNILSQQSALEVIWNLDENDRFLSYLPWHHSFGGIFERFTALYNGATLSLESGYGKDPELILENWKLIKPTVFFSVPKVYQALVALSRNNPEAEDLLFNSGLKFIFTAAAPLPRNISDEFEGRGIPVIEGWGLTETSPCCTITEPDAKREPGVVGKPIPGVQVRIAGDGEIQVKGPNVMAGYFRNDQANQAAFTNDGWYRTGDIGEITEGGVKLISRKDRIFKLSNGEKVIPTDLEALITDKCHYVSFAMVTGSGRDYPVALLFPNKRLLESPDYSQSPMERCFCPRNLEELSRCLLGCLNDANCGIGQKCAVIKSAMLVDDELTIENSTVTPSLKISPANVTRVYSAHLENLYGNENPIREKVYVIPLEKVPARAGQNEDQCIT